MYLHNELCGELLDDGELGAAHEEGGDERLGEGQDICIGRDEAIVKVRLALDFYLNIPSK